MSGAARANEDVMTAALFAGRWDWFGVFKNALSNGKGNATFRFMQ